MQAIELQALRRLLGLSVAEAARWLAADAARPQGVEERTWNRWEAGARPVPDNVAAALLELVAWWCEHLAQLRAELASGPAAQPLRVLWYAEPDDCPPGPPALQRRQRWRPGQAAAAQLLAEAPAGAVQLVSFDPAAFARWRQPLGLADDDAARAAWAAAAAQGEGAPPPPVSGNTTALGEPHPPTHR